MQRSERSPLRFAVIGAGMSGILAAIKLREAGYDDFAVYEKAAKVGGTWRENTYPGIACDVPSHLYSYSFEPNPVWTRRFAPGAEIQAYFESVAQKHRVQERIRFGAEVERLTWKGGRWQLETRDGRRDEVDVVIAATGVLHHPRMPEIEGLDHFLGAHFHSARWDHSVKIDGRRVGVVGTGSSAVQIVGAIAERVGKLTLFQRSAQWIMPQDNPHYSEAERAEYQQKPELLFQLHDDQAKLFAMFSNGLVDMNSAQMKMIEDACKANLEQGVRDASLREKLTPSYRAACKRLVMSPDFYQAVQQPQAQVVTEAIERVEAEGVRTRDGKLHPLDVLVLATGFRVDRFLRPTQVVGTNRVRLDDVWAERPLAYLSISVPGFPNLFMLNGPNGPVGNFSLIEVAELQLGYVMQLVSLLRDGRARAVSASERATLQLEAERSEAAKHTIWGSGCRSWYLDDRGIPMSWPWTFDRFREEMSRPKLEAYELA